jgi:hypothetical protein
VNTIVKHQFDNGDIVQYDHPKFGTGKGVIVGCNETNTEWIVYPKNKLSLERMGYFYFCFLCKTDQLISTPF